jgi:hypothetical protein
MAGRGERANDGRARSSGSGRGDGGGPDSRSGRGWQAPDGTDRAAERGAGRPAPGAILKTGAFLACGAAALVVGLFAQPRFTSSSVAPREERKLFPELSDAAKATSLEIVRYDEGLATIKQFKVAQTGGVWVLPAFQNYPADAKDQLAAAATELVDREYVDLVSDSPGDHAKFGVVEPDPDKIKPGDTGVGELIDIRDGNGARLARLIVGKEYARAGGAKPLRYVRRAGQDPVYLVELDTSKFTMSFGDWIEKDLLKLSPWDVRKVVLDDYKLEAVDQGGQIGVEQVRKDRIELAYEDREAKWNLVALDSFASGKPEPQQLGENEELASARLNDLRNALGDLKIVDVVRKPAGLSVELKAEESFTGDREAIRSLQQRGFLPLRSGEILSTDGETIVGMRDGVEYVLRFGAATAVGGADAAAEAGAAEGQQQQDGRYLLVMARFNEALLEKPRLDPVPDGPIAPAAEPKAPAAPATEAAPAAPETPPANDAPPTADAPPAADPAPPAADAATPLPAAPGEQGEQGAAGQSGATAAEQPAAPPTAPAGEGATAPAAPNAASAADALKAADEAEAKAQQQLEERRRIERENRRRQDEYDDKVKGAQKRVRELNARFADWYYVVPAKEYARIHLDRAGVIQPKSSAPAEPAPPGIPPQ